MQGPGLVLYVGVYSEEKLVAGIRRDICQKVAASAVQVAMKLTCD